MGLIKRQGPRAGDRSTAGGIIVDPIIELTQPGGPFPMGHALLTDGLGGYMLDSTLRPYLLSFGLNNRVPANGSTNCSYQGVDTSKVGLVIPFESNLIAISIAINIELSAKDSYTVEIFGRRGNAGKTLGQLVLVPGNRTAFRRDLSVEIPAGTELGARVIHTMGNSDSVFTSGLISIELEA
jgi:hypothetical protein